MDENAKSVREFEIFKDAIRDEDLEVQIQMTRKLATLAEHLGAEVTRDELLPFIKENIDFHDEILLNLSEQLNRFIPLVGGYEHSQPILDLLRKLCNTDETIVRNKTVDTLKDIAQNLNDKLIEQLFLPVLEALSNGDWFTSKCSAVMLYPTVYSKVSTEKKVELRHTFRVLVQDESPIVRKAAARSLVDFIAVLEKEFLINEFIPVLDNIFEDHMSSVKANALPLAVALSKRLSENEVEEFVFEILTKSADDVSWEIRQVLAHHIADLQDAIPYGKMRGKILAIYQGLVNDMEERVRTEAAKNLSNYCRSLKKSYESQSIDNFEPVFRQSLVPHIKLMAKDPYDEVKLALSLNILTLSSIVTEPCFEQTIMPIITDILEQDQSMPVHENLFQNLNNLPGYIDLTQHLSSIKNMVRSLIINSRSHWRARRSLLVAFMHIAKFASKDYFSENLKVFYATLLGDPVFAVRRTSPVILPLLAKQYGFTWTAEHVMPYFKMFRKDSRYLYRFVPLFGISELVRPSVRAGNQEIYLNNLNGFVSGQNEEVKSRAAKILARVQRITAKLRSKLEESAYRGVLLLKENIDDFRTDNIVLYSEDCMETLKKNTDSDVFSINKESILDGAPTYLEGLMTLLYNDLLELILNLSKDPTENVKIRSIFVLNGVKEFIDSLSTEMEEPWVAEALKLLSVEESQAIDEEVESQLSRKNPYEKEVDTELMENTDVFDQLAISASDCTEREIQLPETSIPKIKVEAVDEVKTVDDVKENAEINVVEDVKAEVDDADQFFDIEEHDVATESKQSTMLTDIADQNKTEEPPGQYSITKETTSFINM